MQARFKVTIHKLKNNLSSGRRKRRCLEARLRRRDAGMARLVARCDQLEQRLSPAKIPNHHYPAQMIALAVFIVTQANGSLRCAAKAAAFLAQLMGWEYGQPSHASVDNWSRRLGLYALDHSSPKSGRYAAIIDESIQIGREKCLLLLGVKLDPEQSHFAPLTFEEVEVLGVEVQNSWKSEQVADFIEQRLESQPELDLQYMISDRGSNLLGALKKLGLDAVSDCSHVIMNTLKKCLQDYAPLQALTAFMGTYRAHNALSERSHLCPPTLRAKDRFIRIFHVLDWIDRLNTFWPQIPQAHRQTLEYIYTPQVQKLITTLRQLRQIISVTTGILKSSGLNAQSYRVWNEWQVQFSTKMTSCLMAEQLLRTIDKYFADYETLSQKHQRLLCCSDIIESTFGYYKNKGGMKVISSDVLHLPLLRHTIDLDFVCKGLATVDQHMLTQWTQQHICENRYRKLRTMNRTAKAATAAA